MTKIHMWPEEAIVKEDLITTGFTYEEADGEYKSAWYRLPSEFAPAVTHWCDPFVLAILFKAMSTPSDLIVHGRCPLRSSIT